MNIKIKPVLIALMLVLGLTVLAPALPVLADSSSEIQSGINQANGSSGSTDTTDHLNNTIATVLNILSVAIGVVAVVMLMMGGYRYITSAGNADKVATAKKTILYAVIGLVIVALSQLIAKFVLSKASNPTATSMVQIVRKDA